MQDFEGTEIKVGDEVLQTGCISRVDLRRRRVLEVYENSVLLAAEQIPDGAKVRTGRTCSERANNNQVHPEYRARTYHIRNSVCRTPAFLFVIPKDTK